MLNVISKSITQEAKNRYQQAGENAFKRIPLEEIKREFIASSQ